MSTSSPPPKIHPKTTLRESDTGRPALEGISVLSSALQAERKGTREEQESTWRTKGHW